MLGKFFTTIGIKPLTDVVTGENGIVSLLKENSEPGSKISSRKSAASALIFAAIALSTGELNREKIALIAVFAVCGSALLALTAWKSGA